MVPVWPCLRLVVEFDVVDWIDVETTMSIDDVDILVRACEIVHEARNRKD